MGSGTKRVMVTLPYQLLEEVDRLVRAEKRNRSQLVAEAMTHYLRERKREQLRQELREGYIQMAKLNLQLAEEDTAEIEELYLYEERLAEAK